MSIMDCFSLKGKVALMTGGAGLYGTQIVSALAQAGATTYIASRNIEQLEITARSQREEGYEVFALRLDQGDEKSIYQLRDEILRREQRVDILVNNAVLRTMSGWQDDAENFAKSMQINATGVFMITRAFGDIMAQNGGGSIVNVGSIQGMIGPDASLYRDVGFTGYIPDYFFHKGGMINFTRFTASYYGPHNVRCNCISPGGLKTEKTHEEFVRRYSERTFLGRMGNNTDLMGIIVFLASDASLYITGANIPVDGGYTAK
ncbi:NAD(P)-dependent dehydrogenase (short-subunit alcohol dehydrogenase family) [Anaerobacterium chartisolvens]|uniref:NAD(P)-dependent dehydrogenase (Short-subunit alcohol dehydrogenase family) n=1 Tax=Anaerobacterium chartisolvens TaxID=1297424 RepID=A0A369AM28_9FIRM|nr:SDR family oxidoreductase [Anaerobacterium chartisolvens]RCX09336.1 NAD(P)-dependent dehydrogenase (short-subunit alcohol dehydrogenase family) [Anaerobacterium chartisolvens]